MSDVSPAIRAAVRIAFSCLEELSSADQEAVLVALVETADAEHAQIANDVLFYRRQAAKAQLTLKAILEGIGADRRRTQG